MTTAKLLPLLLSALALAGCDSAAHGSNRAADATQRAFHDTTEKWKGLFSYNPQKVPPQAPQSRYCYQMQTDIVCYDSAQPNMTAVLSGYQDGANISSFQPGGGSLGVSGGEPTAMYRTEEVHTSLPQIPKEPTVAAAVDPTVYSSAPATPFQSHESNYVHADGTATIAAPATPAPTPAKKKGAAPGTPAPSLGTPIVINDNPIH